MCQLMVLIGANEVKTVHKSYFKEIKKSNEVKNCTKDTIVTCLYIANTQKLSAAATCTNLLKGLSIVS